ncbi:peroxidase family protein [Spongiactinospora sp. TRM90649]|uniref:peroxidase family protein n=1 Tax=Spongiactinospora sp. TRM90649 TaxID=3031114 RepID=UPI0023F67BCF|nr:peroxidase family protein [Spongiactinospora sp. TRM90649]MDF5753250.1 peroxidase family protein [Spongiactinospora sp. TRM90649]
MSRVGRVGRGSTARSAMTDGAANRLRFLALTGGRPFWDLVQAVGPVRRRLNALLIDAAVREMPPRPEPLSTMSDYTSWASLTDRTYSGRHVPPMAGDDTRRPSSAHAADLFTRGDAMIPCPRSTVLFAYFAQWFTDGFLRGQSSPPRDPRKNTSNHQIDLNQLYGLDATATAALRTFEGGRLKSRSIGGGEFPPLLCENGEIKPEFAALRMIRFEEMPTALRDTLFATGSDRGNTQIGFTMLTVLFLREHNRVAGLLAANYPKWDDERLFQTARNILIVLLIKLVIEEYVNHITPYHFRFRLDSGLSARLAHAPWFRENWASVEFNLVYRWHQLIPSRLRVGGRDLPMAQTLMGSALIPGPGLGTLFEEASRQRAGRIGLFNTDPVLREVDIASVEASRTLGLAPYNSYREHCRFPRIRRFEHVNADPRVSDALRERYRGVDDIDLYVGMFAEEPGSPEAILPPLLTKIIAVDAFSQALTNPLLAPRVFNAATFSPCGLRVIATTRSLSDVLHRNVPEDPRPRLVSMSRGGTS